VRDKLSWQQINCSTFNNKVNQYLYYTTDHIISRLVVWINNRIFCARKVPSYHASNLWSISYLLNVINKGPQNRNSGVI